MKIIVNEKPKPQSRPRFNSRTKRAYEKSDITNYKNRVGYAAKQVIKEPIEKGTSVKSFSAYEGDLCEFFGCMPIELIEKKLEVGE